MKKLWSSYFGFGCMIIAAAAANMALRHQFLDTRWAFVSIGSILAAIYLGVQE